MFKLHAIHKWNNNYVERYRLQYTVICVTITITLSFSVADGSNKILLVMFVITYHFTRGTLFYSNFFVDCKKSKKNPEIYFHTVHLL